MAIDLSTVIQGFQLKPFTLASLKDFPLKQWADQQEMYAAYESWYRGDPLEVTITDKNTGRTIEKYPIKINPIKQTCKVHAARVIGQNIDSIRLGGMPFQLIPDVKEDQKEVGDKLKEILTRLFTKSGFGSLFLSSCIRSQYLGGAVVMSKWLPLEKQIEISTPSPKEGLFYPDGANLNVLREAWIVKEISQNDAVSLGYKLPAGKELDPQNLDGTIYYYIEHWTKTSYTIQINEQILELNGQRQAGTNPYGLVPIVYVPHIRIDHFLGDSVITETIKGVIKEINLRWADIGDAVSDDAHGYVAVRNISGNVDTINVGDDRPVLNLGGTTGIGTTAEPDMFAVETKSASDPMLNFVKELYGIYRREANHPAVADGEDEGSQRSSLTLAARMAPLVDEAEFERLFWTVGMLEFARILLTVCLIKNIEGVTVDMLNIPLIAQWQPMLPRDRDAMTTEAATRSKNFITSNRHLNELYGDVLDPEEDWKQVVKEQTEIYKAQAIVEAAKQQAFQDSKNNAKPAGTSGSDNNKPNTQ